MDYLGFSGPLRGVFFAAGLWWAALGAAFVSDAALRSLAAARAGGFPTRGSFAASRHPFWSWWIFFAFPAAALLSDNALFFLASILGSAAAPRLLLKTERAREERFGETYRRCAAGTNLVVPLPRRVRPLPKAIARLGLFGLLVGVYSAAAYFALVAPAMTRFGTVAAERKAAWPGDDWAGQAAGGFTQAVTIQAPPEAVWPWIVQVGYRRAGWYNIDAVNGLAAPDYFFEGKGSAKRVVPELQKLSTGDEILLVPGMGFRVAVLEPGRTLLLLGGDPEAVAAVRAGAPMPPGYAAVSWLFALSPTGDGGTRLVSRFRSVNASMGPVGDFLWSLVGTLGGAVLQQPAMFYGLAARAEGRIAQ